MEELVAKPLETLVAEARATIAREITVRAEQLDVFEHSLDDLRDRQKKLQEEIDRLLEAFRDHRKKLGEEIERQLDHLAETSMRDLRALHKKLEETVAQQLDNLEKYEPPPPPTPVAPLDKLLNSVRNLITATLPDQLLESLAEEADHLGVRAAVFDVRGKAAWGLAARGFDSNLSEKTFRALVVPLNQEGPFRQVFETGGHVDANADLLRRNRNILEKLKPGKQDGILLLPIRSAGSVSAIFYADSGGKAAPLPTDALKILTEFTGAQLDRLMALSGGGSAEEEEDKPAHQQQQGEQELESVPEAAQPEPEKDEIAEDVSTQPPPPAEQEAAPPLAEPEPPPAAQPSFAPSVAAREDVSPLSEEEQKYHKDATRFAKLLISEIDLYNKTKVADGRKNKDLYKRLKSDIERSRQTFRKRFTKRAANGVDDFHEELVRILANNDASVLGPDYPGPSA